MKQNSPTHGDPMADALRELIMDLKSLRPHSQLAVRLEAILADNDISAEAVLGKVRRAIDADARGFSDESLEPLVCAIMAEQRKPNRAKAIKAARSIGRAVWSFVFKGSFRGQLFFPSVFGEQQDEIVNLSRQLAQSLEDTRDLLNRFAQLDGVGELYEAANILSGFKIDAGATSRVRATGVAKAVQTELEMLDEETRSMAWPRRLAERARVEGDSSADLVFERFLNELEIDLALTGTAINAIADGRTNSKGGQFSGAPEMFAECILAWRAATDSLPSAHIRSPGAKRTKRSRESLYENIAALARESGGPKHLPGLSPYTFAEVLKLVRDKKVQTSFSKTKRLPSLPRRKRPRPK